MTAKEFLRNKKNEIGLRSQSSPLGSEGNEIEVMIEFAKYHVEEALKEAYKNSVIITTTVKHEGVAIKIKNVAESSIINAYPLEKIK